MRKRRPTLVTGSHPASFRSQETPRHSPVARNRRLEEASGEALGIRADHAGGERNRSAGEDGPVGYASRPLLDPPTLQNLRERAEDRHHRPNPVHEPAFFDHSDKLEQLEQGQRGCQNDERTELIYNFELKKK